MEGDGDITHMRPTVAPRLRHGLAQHVTCRSWVGGGLELGCRWPRKSRQRNADIHPWISLWSSVDIDRISNDTTVIHSDSAGAHHLGEFPLSKSDDCQSPIIRNEIDQEFMMRCALMRSAMWIPGPCIGRRGKTI